MYVVFADRPVPVTVTPSQASLATVTFVPSAANAGAESSSTASAVDVTSRTARRVTSIPPGLKDWGIRGVRGGTRPEYMGDVEVWGISERVEHLPKTISGVKRGSARKFDKRRKELEFTDSYVAESETAPRDQESRRRARCAPGDGDRAPPAGGARLVRPYGCCDQPPPGR